MDSDIINPIVEQKYSDKRIKGEDYLQKIVQLHFKIPNWKEKDISESIAKIISKGLAGSSLLEDFETNKQMIVNAIQLNPRQVKRFINNVILAKAVIDKPIDELIVVQGLNFRSDWNAFLDLITPDITRKVFLMEYLREKKERKPIINTEQLDNQRCFCRYPCIVKDLLIAVFLPFKAY